MSSSLRFKFSLSSHKNLTTAIKQIISECFFFVSFLLHFFVFNFALKQKIKIMNKNFTTAITIKIRKTKKTP